MEMRHLKPAREGLKVPHPGSTRFLPPEGEAVPWSSYWRRRALDGDVVVVRSATEDAGTLRDEAGRDVTKAFKRKGASKGED